MKKFVLFSCLILLVFFFFRDSLGFYFISDDFFHLSFRNFSEAVSFQRSEYHYVPVFWLTMLGLKTLFGFNPFPFHLITVILHLLNIVLVFFVSRLVSKSVKSGLMAAVAFAFFFSHYEVVYWITGLSTSIMVFFYLLGLLSFVLFCQNSRPLFYILFIASLLLALLSHEYAVSLLVVSFLYWFLLSGEKVHIFKAGKIFITPFILFICWLLFKLKFSYLPLVAKGPTVFSFGETIVKSLLYLFIANPYFVDGFPTYFLKPLSMAILLILLFASKKNRKNLFLFLWMDTTILVIAFLSNPQARYYYLCSIPAIILSVSFLLNTIPNLLEFAAVKTPSRCPHGLLEGGESYKFIDDGYKYKYIRFLPFLYFLFITASSIIFLQEQKTYWQKGSEITKNTLSEFKTLYPKLNKSGKIYFVNLPDNINGPPWNAYVFRRDFDIALNLYYGLNPKNISFLRTVSLDGKIRNDPYVDLEFLRNLKKKGESIFIYHSEIGKVILFGE